MSPGQVRTGIGDGYAKNRYRSQIGQPRDLDDGFSNSHKLTESQNATGNALAADTRSPLFVLMSAGPEQPWPR